MRYIGLTTIFLRRQSFTPPMIFRALYYFHRDFGAHLATTPPRSQAFIADDFPQAEGGYSRHRRYGILGTYIFIFAVIYAISIHATLLSFVPDAAERPKSQVGIDSDFDGIFSRYFSSAFAARLSALAPPLESPRISLALSARAIGRHCHY